MTVHIGQWVQRERRSVAHLAESLIDGDAIARCGRRLSDEPTRRGKLIEAPYGQPKCRQCVGYLEKETPQP